jgi:SP family sugar:H+ symporter-like MFS transporter
MATFGIFFANAVMYSLHDQEGAFGWRFAIGIQLLWAFFVAIGTALAPESPRYYVLRGKIDQARVNLSKLRGLEQDDPELLAEMEAIQKSVDDEKLAANATYLDCFRSKDRMLMRTMNGILIQVRTFAVLVLLLLALTLSSPSQRADGSAVDRCQLLLLLRNQVLRRLRYLGRFPDSAHPLRCQRRRYLPRSLRRRLPRPPYRPLHRFRHHVLRTGSSFFLSLSDLPFMLTRPVYQVIAGAVSTAKPGDKAAGQALIFASCWFIFGFASSWGPLGWVRLLPSCSSYDVGCC